jgi:hypothetical protein
MAIIDASVGEVLDDLADVAGGDLGGEDAGALLLELEALRCRLEATRLRVAQRFDASGDWARSQARSAAGWLAIITGASRSSMGSLFHLAGRTAFMAGAMAAFAAAEITESHLRLLARCVGPRTREAYWRDEDLLVAQARELGAEAFARVIDHWLALADPDGAEPAGDPTRDCVTLQRLFSGRWHLDGDLCDETGLRLRSLLDERSNQILHRDRHLEALDPTDPIAVRTVWNRRAQALVELVDAGAATPDGAARKPAFTILVDPQTAQGLPTDTPLRDTLYGHLVPPLTLERLRCDATWSVAVLGDAGEILSLGRETRYANRSQRRALAARDRGCVVPGCGAPIDHTDAHHINYYEHGGHTDCHNLCLLCRHHHRRVHDGHLLIEMIDGKPHVTLSNGMPLTTRLQPVA